MTPQIKNLAIIYRKFYSSKPLYLEMLTLFNSLVKWVLQDTGKMWALKYYLEIKLKYFKIVVFFCTLKTWYYKKENSFN